MNQIARATAVADEFRIAALEAPLGAEVHGLDLSQPPSPRQVLALREGLRQHHVLLFRNQSLTDRQYQDFVTLFGPVFQPPSDVPVLSSGADGKAPVIVKVANAEDGELGNAPLAAHIDHQWTPAPSASSFLQALAVPDSGGETLFTNLVLAYERLDAATRETIDALRLITYNPFVRIRQNGGYGGTLHAYRTPDIEPVQGSEHPLVRTHPESGRRLLFLSARTEVEIPGYDPERGAALIARLREHLARPELTYTHRWRVGDILWWDNQATLHARNGFPEEQQRRLQRISIGGGRPF